MSPPCEIKGLKSEEFLTFFRILGTNFIGVFGTLVPFSPLFIFDIFDTNIFVLFYLITLLSSVLEANMQNA